MSMYEKLKYFEANEFSRPDEMDGELLLELDSFREFIRKPVIVTSSNSNSDLHVENSYHYKGLAVDIIVPRFSSGLFDLFLVATRFRFSGIGIYPFWNYLDSPHGGLHLDMRPIESQRGTRMGVDRKPNRTTRLNTTYIELNHQNLAKYHLL